MKGTTILLISFLLFACNSSDRTIKKAKNVRKGMTMSEVRSIMGDPSDSLPGYFDKTKIMFLYELSFASSEDIQIYFDSSKLLVTNIILPKGE